MLCCIVLCYHHKVSSQESLQEATLATANGAKHITAEDVALGLLLLQVNLLVPSHCRGEKTKETAEINRERQHRRQHRGGREKDEEEEVDEKDKEEEEEEKCEPEYLNARHGI